MCNEYRKNSENQDPKTKYNQRKAHDNNVKGKLGNVQNFPLAETAIKSGSCSNILEKGKDGKIRPKYTCKKKWCTMCNARLSLIRFNAYSEELAEIFEELGLNITTLTQPNVYYNEDIKHAIYKLKQAIKQFRRKYKRNTGETFKGVLSIEIEVTKTGGYHVHAHILHQSLKLYKQNGIIINDLIAHWLKSNKESTIYGQHTKQVQTINGNINKALAEILKYINKGIYNFKDEEGIKREFIPVNELAIIYTTICGYKDQNGKKHNPIRTFEAFGLNKKLTEQTEEELTEQLTAYKADESKPTGEYQFNKNTWSWELQEHYDNEGIQITKKGIKTNIAHTITIPLWEYKVPNWRKEQLQELEENKYYKQWKITAKQNRIIADQYEKTKLQNHIK